MNVYVIVNQPRDWPFEIPGVTVMSAREYLADPVQAAVAAPARVFNLCRTDRYQGRGYYVSLLAEARGHEPVPDVKTIEDLHAGSVLVVTGPDGVPVPFVLHAEPPGPFELDAYFGRDPEGRNDAAAGSIFARLKGPLVRTTFHWCNGHWNVAAARLLTPGELSVEQREFAGRAAALNIVPARPRQAHPPDAGRCALAILHTPGEPDPPSNPAALEHFLATARAIGMRADMLSRDDIDRLPDYDALFIRDTTHVNHYTYQFARRAAAEGLVVMDDPDSILKCTNKVYLNELFVRHQVPVPRTLIVHRDNVELIVANLGLPCIVKQPDSAFSLGVSKVATREALDTVLASYFARSELVVAQEWLPTSFDWRVGVLDGRPLYVCKYLMAPGHWQVVKRERGRKLEGDTVAIPVGEAPKAVVETAVRAANLIGDGLYGVDLKQVEDRCCVIEINDNPNIDAGNEDAVLKDALYREVLGVFVRRVRERGRMAAD